MITDHDNIKTCMFFGITIFSFSFSFFIYRKLKFINVSNKNIENFRKSIHQVQQIRDKVSMNTVSVARRSNPLVRFITNFTGLSNAGNDKDERRPFVRPSTAEAGSQVCHEIIAKREKRSNVPQNDEGEETPREGFVQEMFGSSSSSSCCGSTQVDQKTSETHTCSVCLDELSIGNGNTTTTECGHTFHLSCLLKSLTQKNTCPMCRGELESERTKQLPSNVLTPTSAEQIIAEEISYFNLSPHIQSIILSRHPNRRAKEMLRVFGFTLLQSVAEYVHDENMPPGWYDDGESESETEDEDEDDDDEGEDDNQEEENSEDQGDQDDDDQGNQGDQGDQDDEFNYAYASRASRGDLRDSIGR
jgi:Zinc finger, C3HC4 type (RING finger)